MRSPINGRASRARLTAGNLVAASDAASVLTTIVFQDRVYTYFEADEKAFLRYSRMARKGERPSERGGQLPVQIALADKADFSHTGTVDFLDNQVDRGSGTIAVRAVLDNKDRVFTPGLYTRVRLVGSGEFSAVLIDDKAVLTDHDRNYVYIVDKDGLAQRRDVKLGGSSHWLRIVRGAGGGRPRDRQRRAEGVLAGHACAGHGGAHGGCCGARVRHQMKHHAGARHRSDVSHNERRGALPLTPFKVLAHGPLKFFMDRPIFAAVLSIVIFVSGLLAIPALPISEYPKVVVRAVYPGANPKVIAETVATPLEEQINGVEGMMYIKSVAGSDGVLVTTVTFRSGINADDATVRVQNRVAQAQARLPAMWCARASPSKSSPRLPDGGAPDIAR